MDVQINTDKNIQGGASLETFFQDLVKDQLKRFEKQITRVEVNIKDTNAAKGGDQDKHCSIEVRLSGLKPTAVTHEDDTVEKAVRGALTKTTRVISSTLGKLDDRS